MKTFKITATFLTIAMMTTSGAAFDSKTQDAINKMGGKTATEVTFDKGSSALSESSKSEIQKMIIDSMKSGTVKRVSVVAWADQEYPQKEATVAQAQIDLAANRASDIEKYLKYTLKVSSVETINMARRPNVIQKTLNTRSAKMKNALESSGAAPTRQDQTGFLGLSGKASEALIIVY